MQRVSSSERNLKCCCNLLSIPEDILGRILFSGYLIHPGKCSDNYWRMLTSLILVNKTFLELAKKYIIHFVNHVHKSKSHLFDGEILQLPLININKVSNNLVYLDLSYSQIFYTDLVYSMFTSYKHSLRGLSLHSSKATNKCLEYIAELSQLKYLDIAQKRSLDKYLITDYGISRLTQLKDLKWINLSCTNISDVSILLLTTHSLFLEYVFIEHCTNLTDISINYLKTLKLCSLQINNCPLITETCIKQLADDSEAPIFQTLKSLFCSYLPLVSAINCLPIFMKMPHLKELEMRQRANIPITSFPDGLLTKARNHFSTLVLFHDDQLKYHQSSSVNHFPLLSLCPIYTWPYKE